MPKMPIPTLYLFNNIFFPQTVIPLTVNDPASKKMLLQCYDCNQRIVLYYPNSKSKGIGTLGKILFIKQESDDNLSVMIEGIVRVKLLSMRPKEMMPAFFIEEFKDTDFGFQSLDHFPLERLYSILGQWLNRHVTSAKGRESFLKDIQNTSKLINHL